MLPGPPTAGWSTVLQNAAGVPAQPALATAVAAVSGHTAGAPPPLVPAPPRVCAPASLREQHATPRHFSEFPCVLGACAGVKAAQTPASTATAGRRCTWGASGGGRRRGLGARPPGKHGARNTRSGSCPNWQSALLEAGDGPREASAGFEALPRLSEWRMGEVQGGGRGAPASDSCPAVLRLGGAGAPRTSGAASSRVYGVGHSRAIHRSACLPNRSFPAAKGLPLEQQRPPAL